MSPVVDDEIAADMSVDRTDVDVLNAAGGRVVLIEHMAEIAERVDEAIPGGDGDERLAHDQQMLPAMRRKLKPPQMSAPCREARPVVGLALLVHRREVEIASRPLDDTGVDLRLMLTGPQHTGLFQLVDHVSAVGDLCGFGAYSNRCADGTGVFAAVTPNQICPNESCPVAPQIACAPGNGGIGTSIASGPFDSIRRDGCFPEITSPCMVGWATAATVISAPAIADPQRHARPTPEEGPRRGTPPIDHAIRPICR